MEELIQELVSKAGISEDQARKAITVMTEYVQAKVPPMLRPTVAKFLAKSKAQEQDSDEDGLF